MRTKDNGKYNTAGSTGKKKRAAFNWLKGVTAVLCAVVMYFAVTIGIRGYDMYKDAIAQVSLEDKINEIRSKKSYTLFSLTFRRLTRMQSSLWKTTDFMDILVLIPLLLQEPWSMM